MTGSPIDGSEPGHLSTTELQFAGMLAIAILGERAWLWDLKALVAEDTR